MSTALMYSPYGATEDLKPSFSWGNALGVGALGLVGYGLTKGGPGHSPSFPAYRKNPLPIVLGLGLGTWALVGGGAWAGYKVKNFFFSGTAVTGMFVGGSLGFAYGMYKDERALGMGFMGMALGWGLMKIYDQTVG